MTPQEEAQDPKTSAERLCELLGIQPTSLEAGGLSFRVKILSSGSYKIAAIKVIRDTAALSLKDGKMLVESAPCFIEKELSFSAAVGCVAGLFHAGASAKLEALDWSPDPILCRLIAQHPNASEPLLRCLLLSNDTETYEQIAKNPNLSFELIGLVAPLQPLAFLENPLLPLLLLEDPALTRLGEPALIAMLCSDELLPVLLPAAFASVAASEFLASGTMEVLPPEAIEALANHPNERVRWYVAQNSATPTPTVERLAKSDSGQVRRGAAQNPKLPSVLLQGLLEDPVEMVRDAAKTSWAKRNKASETPQDQ